jgi:hypothetical protein
VVSAGVRCPSVKCCCKWESLLSQVQSAACPIDSPTQLAFLARHITTRVCWTVLPMRASTVQVALVGIVCFSILSNVYFRTRVKVKDQPKSGGRSPNWCLTELQGRVCLKQRPMGELSRGEVVGRVSRQTKCSGPEARASPARWAARDTEGGRGGNGVGKARMGSMQLLTQEEQDGCRV